MDVSLYIPCYNVAPYLDRVIPAVMAQTYPLKEVLLIDDGSTDDTLGVAGKYREGTKYPLRIVRHDQNRGLAAARNTGLREARSEFVASLDADCVPDPAWLAHCMGRFTDETIAGVGGQLVESVINGTADAWRAFHMNQQWGTDVVMNPKFLFGHSNVFRASALRRCGYYDERFRTNAEDYHACLALYRKGYRLVYEPRAAVFHLKTDTAASVLTAFWRYSYWGFKPTAFSVVKRCLWHVKRGLELLISDVRSRRFSLAPISIVSPLVFLYRELQAWAQGKQPPRPDA
jgi:glycosyltransferase involved in cell wall biosynthesis